MEIKNILSSFDDAVKEQEEAAVKSVEQTDETKETETKTEEEVKTDEAEKDEATKEAETDEAEEVKVPETTVVAEEVGENIKDENKAPETDEEEATKSVDEKDTEEVTKATDDKEDVEADKNKKDKKKAPKKPESEQDEDAEDEGAEGNSKKKPEKVKKSDTAAEDLAGVLEVVLKSYQVSTASQNQLATQVSALQAQVSELKDMLAESEEVNKSVDLETKTAAQEVVADKAVGYVAKNENVIDDVSGADVAVAEQTEVAAAEQTEEDALIFDAEAERTAFLAKYQADAKAKKINRGDMEELRVSFLDARSGLASAEQLQNLRDYVG